MNSEELEQSLRTEFESYLRNVLADMRQEVSQFQIKLDTEFENHKTHLDEVIKDFSSRIGKDPEFDVGFRESIVEHLRLARDEGATITATAIAEAEELAKAERKHAESVSSAAPSVELGDIRNAIYDISSQNSQSAILKALIDHASKFTPRGAFFVVKNQHFVGWRVFGKQETAEDASIGDVVFPVSSSTVLGDSVKSLSVIESAYGNYLDDAEYLFRLDFGKPTKMFAIPLIARGRGVAAIYADCGKDGGDVNIEALETLVSVAGLTVELLAAAQTSQYSRGAVRTAAQPQTTAPHRDEDEFEGETDAEFTESVPDTLAVQELAAADLSEPEELKAGEAEEAEFKAADETGQEEETAGSETAEVSDAAASPEEIVEAPVETVFSVSGADESLETAADAIAEVHSLPEEVEEVAKGVSEPVFEAAGAEEEPGEADVDASIPSPVSDVSTEKFESLASDTDAEYDDSAFQPAADVEDLAESKPLASEPQFETNQDFNSSPVQFGQPAEAAEPEEAEVVQEASEPEEAEGVQEASGPEVDEMVQETAPNEVIEEVSAAPSESFESFEVAGTDEEAAAEVVVEPVAVPPIKTRLSERNVELPIDVSEEERRLHNDARRFARLLVSEIKLYNEQKVKEGRESNDLYERLREAIDRSREMYDKRVQPTVVKRFDYFHYEVVNNLADGEEARLGSAYPGSTP